MQSFKQYINESFEKIIITSVDSPEYLEALQMDENDIAIVNEIDDKCIITTKGNTDNKIKEITLPVSALEFYETRKAFHPIVEQIQPIVSFDFDSVLANTRTDPIKGYAKDELDNLIIDGPNNEYTNKVKEYNRKGYKVVIVSARPTKDRNQIVQFVQEHNLPVLEADIYCTTFRPKTPLLNKLNVFNHYDDDEKTITALNADGKERGILVTGTKPSRPHIDV